MNNAINKLSYYSHSLQCLWEDLDEYVENDESELVIERISQLQESIPEVVDYIVQEMDELQIALAGAEAELKTAKDKYQLRVDEVKKRIQSRIDVLTKLHEKEVIPSEIIGNTKRITFQLNPPKVEELLIDPSSSDFPEHFKEVRIDYIPLKKEILAAAKRGEDVEKICKISRSVSPRFKIISGNYVGRKS